MAKATNTSDASTNVTGKAGLITDLNPTYVSQEQYTHARNAVRNSKEGDLGTISNEPSLINCINAPYKIVGHVVLPDDKILVFSTNGASSEIGLGDEALCSYSTLSKLDCWNFSPDFPITGVAKNDFQRGTIVTFTDKFNPVRRIELKKIGQITDCDDSLLFKKIAQPCITVRKGQVGNMPNGTYSVAIAYVVDNQIFSDFYSISNRISLFSEIGANSLEVRVDNLDTEFDQFALIVIGNYIDPTTQGVTKLAKQVGIFSTRTKTIPVTDFINPTLEEIQLSNLLIQKKTWQKAGMISANSNFLLIGDLVARPEEDYQLKAMGIKVEYTIEQVPADYYEIDGSDVNYYRDENYDYYIQGVYNTGEMTDKFHIPGPRPTARDLQSVSSADVYELDQRFVDCQPDEKIPYTGVSIITKLGWIIRIDIS